MTVTQLQSRLASLGFDPGPIDGAMGRRTRTAIIAFQQSRQLVADGIAGPMTLAALAGAPPPLASPLASLALPWLLEAQRCIGITEATGPANNPLIIGWGARLRIDYAYDEIPWCGLFVAHCIGSQLPTEPLPVNPLGARNWGRMGVACAVPQPGAVMVFWRKSMASGQGHVGFYIGEDRAAYHILGGNQGNKVGVMRMARTRFLGARWPISVAPAAGGPRRLQPDGALSNDEQ